MNRDLIVKQIGEARSTAEKEPLGDKEIGAVRATLLLLEGAVKTKDAGLARAAARTLMLLAEVYEARPFCSVCESTDVPLRAAGQTVLPGGQPTLICQGCYMRQYGQECSCPVGDPDCMGEDGDSKSACERLPKWSELDEVVS